MNTNINKVHFVGAGPGDKELITLKGYKLLSNADVVIYAGSLVNPELLDYCKEGCEIHDSAYMTLEEIINVMEKGIKEGKSVVRLQTGDFSIYGSIREQVEDLAKLDIDYDCTPGVSSFLGASSALGVEYTVPEVSQSVVITRMEGRTPGTSKRIYRIFRTTPNFNGNILISSRNRKSSRKINKRWISKNYSNSSNIQSYLAR